MISGLWTISPEYACITSKHLDKGYNVSILLSPVPNAGDYRENSYPKLPPYIEKIASLGKIFQMCCLTWTRKMMGTHKPLVMSANLPSALKPVCNTACMWWSQTKWKYRQNQKSLFRQWQLSTSGLAKWCIILYNTHEF